MFCLYAYLWSIFVFFFRVSVSSTFKTLSLHDALPIYFSSHHGYSFWWSRYESSYFLKNPPVSSPTHLQRTKSRRLWSDRKSTRLNSSHVRISYAVFCLKNTSLFSKCFSVAFSNIFCFILMYYVLFVCVFMVYFCLFFSCFCVLDF